MSRVVRHRKVAGGTQDNTKEVSRNEWNDGHSVGYDGPFEAFTDCVLVVANTLDATFLSNAHGAGGTVVALNSTDPALQGGRAVGVAEFSTGTTSNTIGAAGWGVGPGSILNAAQTGYVGLSDLIVGQRMRASARLRMPTLLSGGDDTYWRVGFGQMFSGTAQCCVVEWNPPLFGSNELRLRTAGSGTSGLVNLGYTVVAGEWFVIDVEVGADPEGARARVNGGSWVAGTSDLPTARMTAGGLITKSGATAHTNARRLQLDWFGTVWPLSTVRGYA